MPHTRSPSRAITAIVACIHSAKYAGPQRSKINYWECMSDSAVREQGSPTSDRWPASANGTHRRVTAVIRRTREVLARDLFAADDSAARPAILAVLVAVAAVVALMRLGAQGMKTVWAEDGQVFYALAKHASLAHIFFQTYRGYMHAAPRLVAAVAALFPVKWAASSIAIIDAIALGLLVAVVYRASAAHIRNPWLRVIPALLIAACPVGQETLGSIADLQWFLFPTAVVVLLWNPRRPLPITVGAVTVLLATMSSPFGVLLVPIAVLRAVVFLRNRGTVIPLAALAGFSIQTFIMATTSGRKSYDTVLVGTLIHLFVHGVAGQGFFGTRYHVAWSILGAVVVLLVGVLWVLVALMGSWRQLAVASVSLIYSLGYFAALVVLSGMTIGKPGGARYFIGSLLLMAFAVVVLLDGALRRQSQFRWSAYCRPVALAACAVLLVSLSYSTATSWRAPDPARSTPTWSSALNTARRHCSDGAARVAVPITPVSIHHWKVVLSCSQVADG
jgi:hypothetical protein